MKHTLTFFLLLLVFTTFSQNKADSTNKILTYRFAGEYGYGKDIEKGRIGRLIVYAESDTTLLFYFDLNRGAPSYNIGTLYGRLIIHGDSGTFNREIDNSQNGCKLFFKFYKGRCEIKTVNGQDYCDFGFGVIADGVFKKRKTDPQDNFIDQTGRKVYFRKTKPEEYER